MKIFLVGFMGSGKSTVGKLVAEKLGYSFIDLDDYIEEKQGVTISQMFSDYGECYFRDREREGLKDMYALNDNYIIALGGGAFSESDNWKEINQEGKSIYLQVSTGQLVKRLENEKAKRPLVANSKDLLKDISDRLSQRESKYLKAHLVIDADKNLEDIVEEISKIFS